MGVQDTGSARDRVEASRHQEVNFSASAVKNLKGVPLKVTKENGVFYCITYLPGTNIHFTHGDDNDGTFSSSKFGIVKLISNGSNMGLIGQDKIFTGEISLFVEDPQGLSRIPSVGSAGYLTRNSELEAFDWDDLDQPLPGQNRKKLTEIIHKMYVRHENLRLQAPEEYADIPPSIPKSGHLRELYLDGIEKDNTRLNSVSQEWELMKRGLRRSSQPQTTVKKIKEGWEKFGMLEQFGGQEAVMKNDGGVEFYGVNEFSLKDSIRHEEHVKLDPNKILYQNKRFNAFLKNYPSTSIRPIRQWVNSLADLEEGTLRAIATVLSIGSIVNR